MAKEIDDYYNNQSLYKYSGEPVVLVGILNGSLFFVVDLLKSLTIRVVPTFIKISTYSGREKTDKLPKIIDLYDLSYHDTNVLLVDDIFDRGDTIELAKEHIMWSYPECIKTAVLLNKSIRPQIQPDFIGFDVPNKWIIGYGMDYNNKYRNLPYIAILEEN